MEFVILFFPQSFTTASPIRSLNFDIVLQRIRFEFDLERVKFFFFRTRYTVPKQALGFTCLQYKFLKKLSKRRNARNKQFLLFLKCFLLIWR